MNDTLRDTLKGNAAVACRRVATLRDTARESARSMKIITNNKSAKRTRRDAERRGTTVNEVGGASASGSAGEERGRERHADASIGGCRRALSSDDFGHYDSRAVQNRKMAVPLAFGENLLRQPHTFGPGSNERVIG